MTLGARIHLLMTERGLSQSALAISAGVTQSAISSFISGKRTPSREVLEKLALVLAVSSDWLSRGGSRRGVAEPMRDPKSDLSWHERETYGDGSRFFGNARIEVFQPTLPIFVRETGQNSNDAALESSPTIIEYRLGVLTGERLERFKRALQWEVLERHYDAVASDQLHRTTKRYREGLAHMARTGKLWLLRVDDYGTTGLVGDEFEPGPFSALVRNSQDSQKRDLSAGGRFGLGSSVLSATSAFDLVVFSSKLASPIDGKTEGRTIGRSFLPWHKLDGLEYEGAFYFGKIPDSGDSRRRQSVWAQQDLLEDLWLARKDIKDTRSTGTSALVVGFFDPESGVASEQSSDSVIAKIAESFVDAFWPAIVHGRITAVFTQYDNDSLIYERRVDSSNIVHPFIDVLKNGVNIVEREILLSVPKNRETNAGPFDHSAKALIQVLDPDNSSEERVNEVAMWRRPEMVVRYRTFPTLALGSRPFRAALVCGEAIGQLGEAVTPADVAAEGFLAKAEPPQHNSWTADGTDLVEDYRGGRASLARFEEALKEALRDATRPPNHGEPEGPPLLRELLAIPSEGGTTQRRAYVSQLQWLDSDLTTLSAQVKLSPRKGPAFLIRPVLSAATDKGGISVNCAITEVDGGLMSDANSVTPNPHTRELRLILKPSWDELPVRPELTAVSFEVSVQEIAEA